MRCRLGRAATGHFGGQRASLYPCAVPVPAGVAVPCSLPGLVALPVILPGFMVRALPPWSCGYRRFRRASWASLYSCAVPVPAGVAVPCSLPEFEVLPVILPGLAAPIMPPGLSVRPQCAFARHVGQHRVLCRACGVACHFARACGTHYAARSCGSRAFRRDVFFRKSSGKKRKNTDPRQ